MTVAPLARATLAASRRFGLWPLVLCRMSRSRLVTSASTWRAYAFSNVRSLLAAVSIATSVPSATAAYAPRAGCSWL